MSLRLLQLMCVGQCVELQDMLTKQVKCSKSHNLMRLCVQLYVSVQPLVEYSISLRIGKLAAFSLQLQETLLDAITGRKGYRV